MKRISGFTVIAVMVAAIVLTAQPVLAAEGCVTDKCHSGMGKAKFVHGPVGVGQCTVCHQSGDPNHPTKKGEIMPPTAEKLMRRP